MDTKTFPSVFTQLQSVGCINVSDVFNTRDGFWIIYKSLSDILAEKGIHDFSTSEGTRLPCDRFYDDWYLYAVQGEADFTYSFVKLREEEDDFKDSAPADGDTPGVTISFISFSCDVLTECLSDPTDEKRLLLDREINRVVARRGESHHGDLKRYFINPKSLGTYLIADLYIKYIVSLAKNGYVEVPLCCRERAKKKYGKLPQIIQSLNRSAGYVVCDGEKIYLQNKESITEYERRAILTTHTGNKSDLSFADEVVLHASFLVPLAKIRIPFLGRSAYDSAIRADMTVDTKDFAFVCRYLKDKFRKKYAPFQNRRL